MMKSNFEISSTLVSDHSVLMKIKLFLDRGEMYGLSWEIDETGREPCSCKHRGDDYKE